MTYPSTLSSFNRPTTTDKLNSPSHSALHNTVSSALGQVEAVLGLEGSASTLGTVIYDLRSPASDGGGHVQGANKGGTGQTTFTKGDILVAQSSSVLTRLGVGTDNQVLQANSSVASGINWANATNSRLGVVSSTIGVGATETSIFSVTVPGSTLGSATVRNVVVGRTFLSSGRFDNPGSVLVASHYGGQTVASILVIAKAGTSPNFYGDVTHTVIGDTNNLQRHFLDFQLSLLRDGNTNGNPYTIDLTDTGNPSVLQLVKVIATNTSSVASDAPQTLGMTIRMTNGSVLSTGSYIEKIT